ncbi:hypothetical protein PGTUg99_006130 [Puccinia graminis f. sp. tritici]|uniref:Uncharacterized protein n=1 Tax=Puccinia graminis f. sp. tritici TaxID=56615 RepID=A0A5B0Q1S2_PUCGR|nr:hypothetical protein PGTUg99_006130 [Puccinia graminis f. sp. tritici]
MFIQEVFENRLQSYRPNRLQPTLPNLEFERIYGVRLSIVFEADLITPEIIPSTSSHSDREDHTIQGIGQVKVIEFAHSVKHDEQRTEVDLASWMVVCALWYHTVKLALIDLLHLTTSLETNQLSQQ